MRRKALFDEKDIKKKIVTLRVIDMFWMEHLETMECLRQSVSLRAYGQRDPLVEYKNEGKRVFDQMLQAIDNAIVDMLLKAELRQESASEVANKKAPTAVGVPTEVGNKSKKKVGRNDPCPCGSGLKFKKCHGK